MTSEKEELASSLQETKSALEAANRQSSQAKGEESVESKADRDHLTHTIATLEKEMCQLKEHNAALVGKGSSCEISKILF